MGWLPGLTLVKRMPVHFSSLFLHLLLITYFNPIFLFAKGNMSSCATGCLFFLDCSEAWLERSMYPIKFHLVQKATRMSPR